MPRLVSIGTTTNPTGYARCLISSQTCTPRRPSRLPQARERRTRSCLTVCLTHPCTGGKTIPAQPPTTLSTQTRSRRGLPARWILHPLPRNLPALRLLRRRRHPRCPLTHPGPRTLRYRRQRLRPNLRALCASQEEDHPVGPRRRSLPPLDRPEPSPIRPRSLKSPRLPNRRPHCQCLTLPLPSLRQTLAPRLPCL